MMFSNNKELVFEELSVEFQIIIKTIQCYFNKNDETLIDLEKLFETKINWEELRKLLIRHSILPICYHVWANIDKSLYPESFFSFLKKRMFKTSINNLNHHKELINILDLFEKERIEVLPYKGPVFTKDVYQNLNHRSYSDIDLIVKVEDIEKIEKLLLDRGYVNDVIVPKYRWKNFLKNQNEYAFNYFDEKGNRVFHVELHWKLARRDFQIKIGFDELHSNTKTIEFFNKTINYLSPELVLLTTTVHHGGKDTWRVIKFVCDISAIIQKYECEINWDSFIKKASDYKILNMTIIGIGLANKLFKTPIPKEVSGLINKNEYIKKQIHFYVKSYSKSTSIIERDVTLFRVILLMKMRERTKDKINLFIRYFVTRVLPNEADFEIIQLPKILYPFYYLVKVLRYARLVKASKK